MITSRDSKAVKTNSAQLAVAAVSKAGTLRKLGTATRPPGRVRSDVSRIAILNAALELLETVPLQQLTIESIARQAEVGKATIYRWWPSKASIVIDAFVQNHSTHVPVPRGLTAKETLRKHLQLLTEQYGGWHGRLVAQILAEGQSDPRVLREFRERFAHGRRAMIQEVIALGRRSGEFQNDIDVDIQAEFLYAPIYFRLLVQHLPLDQEFIETLTSTVLKLICVESQ